MLSVRDPDLWSVSISLCLERNAADGRWRRGSGVLSALVSLGRLLQDRIQQQIALSQRKRDN